MVHRSNNYYWKDLFSKETKLHLAYKIPYILYTQHVFIQYYWLLRSFHTPGTGFKKAVISSCYRGVCILEMRQTMNRTVITIIEYWVSKKRQGERIEHDAGSIRCFKATGKNGLLSRVPSQVCSYIHTQWLVSLTVCRPATLLKGYFCSVVSPPATLNVRS